MISFRQRLLATLHAVEPILEEPGVLVVGSEVPNLLEPDAASTLVVSQDVDLAIPVATHARIKQLLDSIRGLRPYPEEPSVWVPVEPDLIEVNFLGLDAALRDPMDAYVLEDSRLPLLVFGGLSLLRPGRTVEVDGLRIPLPAVAGLLLEKLLTDRTGDKGERDLLVALGLLALADEADVNELIQAYNLLTHDHMYTVRSNLTILSLMQPHANMPDPTAYRPRIAGLLRRLEGR